MMLNNKQANLCYHLLSAAINTPQSLAVAVQKRRFKQLTYQEMNFAELNQYSDKIAYAFTQSGFKAGDKAVLMVTPSIDFFAITFALFKAGIVPILVDPGMGIKNLKQCFIEAKPDIFIGIPKAHIARLIFSWGKDTIKKTISVCGLGLTHMNLKKVLKRHPTDQPFPMVMLDKKQMAAILFTSGSTGTPKGVVYTHEMFEAQIEVLKNDYSIKPGERDLATFPLFSLFGPAIGMASIIPDMDASKPITARPKNIFSAIEKYECTNLFANPALIDLLGNAGIAQSIQLKTIKRVISAGAPATLPAIKNFTKLLNRNVEIITSYGATESLPISKIGSNELLLTEEKTKIGAGICVGSPVDHVEITIIETTEKIITHWDESLKLPQEQIGEIVVKGPQVSHCYYNRGHATVAAKIEDADTIRHRMGDLGYIDKLGKLWMCGRKAHRVVSFYKGQSKVYYSIPCERIFNTHPAVKRSALVTVTKNNINIPLICIELQEKLTESSLKLFTELQLTAERNSLTSGIKEFLIHPAFPMDIRHNAKIYREKLSLWAQHKIDK